MPHQIGLPAIWLLNALALHELACPRAPRARPWKCLIGPSPPPESSGLPDPKTLCIHYHPHLLTDEWQIPFQGTGPWSANRRVRCRTRAGVACPDRLMGVGGPDRGVRPSAGLMHMRLAIAVARATQACARRAPLRPPPPHLSPMRPGTQALQRYADMQALEAIEHGQTPLGHPTVCGGLPRSPHTVFYHAAQQQAHVCANTAPVRGDDLLGTATRGRANWDPERRIETRSAMRPGCITTCWQAPQPANE